MTSLELLRPEDSAIQLPQKPVRVLGIDLGTTNSTVAEIIWKPNETGLVGAHCLEIEQFTLEGVYTHMLVPSVVAIHAGKIIVGEGAKRLRARAAELGLEQNKNLFYECKNDIGIKRTYHKAPAGFKSAAEIGGKVLGFLHQAALDHDEMPVNRIVVTVPASFQAAQRHDTLKAAELAIFKSTGGDLLDEPIAAFLDYIQTHGGNFLIDSSNPKNLVVFDFGGGTCDVAVFRLEIPRQGGPLKIAPLAVSRYHRLGGGDIDAAILYEVLIPQLCKQNVLSEFDLSFEEKKKIIEPAFLSVAEALKIGLCIEIARLQKFGRYETADKSQIVKKQPGINVCKLANRTLTLQTPQLTAQEFETLLKTFLDQDLLYARETEYRMTCSIFAPLQDALDRGGLDPKKVDYCLMVGGSRLIPQVAQAVTKFFPHAEILTYADSDSIQTTVARGAAYHALALTIFGKGLIQPICHDRIAIRTVSRPVELIPKGVDLPYPHSGTYDSCYALAVPETTIFDPVELRVEIIAGDEERKLFSGIWKIPGPVKKGDPLCLEFRYDENQILDLKLRLASGDDSDQYSAVLENPLTNVVNPHSKRLKIDELEEDLRTGKISPTQIPDKLVELAEEYADLGQKEKALDYLKRALRGKNEPDAVILNRMAIYYGALGDYEKEQKLYREAASVSSWSGAWFNLALAQKRRGQHAQAIESIEEALVIDREAPCLVLRAMLAEAVGNARDCEKYLEEAMKTFTPIASLTDWELGWFLIGARMAGDDKKVSEAQAEQRKRSQSKEFDKSDQGLLPILTQGLQRSKE